MKFATSIISVLVLLTGCGDAGPPAMTPPPPGSDAGLPPPGEDGGVMPPPPPMVDPWSLDIDMSGLDRFVTGFPETWPVGGVVTASEGLDGLTVAGEPADVADDGSFSVDVPVVEGLNPVPIVARDRATPQHERQGHRSLISAAFRPEGWLNRRAVGVVVTEAMADAMAEPLTAEVESLDLTGEILSRDTLSSDDQCTTWPTGARHGTPRLNMLIDDEGALWLDLYVPDLVIAFDGRCSLLLSTADVSGTISTDVQVYSRLSAPAGDGCVEGLSHTPPYVELPGFDLSVHGSGLSGILISLFSGSREADSRDQMQREFAASADRILDERLAGISLFDRSETFTLFDRDATLDLCLTELGPAGGRLTARLGARVTGSGDHEAPGAPILRGPMPGVGAHTLLLDSQLVGQLVFSAWKAGGLDSEGLGGGDPIQVGILSALVPALRGRFPPDTPIDVSTTAELPPVVRAAPAGDDAEGDLIIEIGDMMIDLSVAGEPLFRLGAVLRLTLDLVPTADRALAPTVVSVEAEAYMLEEPIGDAPDDVIESVVAMKIPETAAGLLDGATIRLPDVGGAINPVDVQPDPRGRYLRIRLAE